jgi:hypothetical protein
MAESLRLTIAKILLKRTLFAGDDAGAETIWRSQRPEVRDSWLQRADAVIGDLEEAGREIRDRSQRARCPGQTV